MQTFLPFSSFKASARVLDNKRLGKQRVETLQLLSAITNRKLITKHIDGTEIEEEHWTWSTNDKKGWANHPAAKMWSKNPETLILYGMTICQEWIDRGFRDTCLIKIRKYWAVCPQVPVRPSWLGDEDFHRSHRSNLLRKDYNHYSQFFFDEVPDNLPYIWPVPE